MSVITPNNITYTISSYIGVTPVIGVLTLPCLYSGVLQYIHGHFLESGPVVPVDGVTTQSGYQVKLYIEHDVRVRYLWKVYTLLLGDLVIHIVHIIQFIPNLHNMY